MHDPHRQVVVHRYRVFSARRIIGTALMTVFFGYTVFTAFSMNQQCRDNFIWHLAHPDMSYFLH